MKAGLQERNSTTDSHGRSRGLTRVTTIRERRFRPLLAGMLVLSGLIFISRAVLSAGTGDSYLQKGIRIISSDERKIVLEATPLLVRWDTLRTNGSLFLLPHLAGEATSVTAPGMPDARSLDVIVTVPGLEGLRLETHAVEMTDFSGDLRPVPSLQYDRDGMAVERFTLSDSASRLTREFPGQAAELIGLSAAKGLVTVRFHPVRVIPASHRISIAKRIVVSLYFGSGGAVPRTTLDPRLASLVINRSSLPSQTSARTLAAKLAAAPVHSVLATGPWFRIETTIEGMYRLDYNTLKSAGVDVDNLDPRTIKVYGNGGKEVPQDLDAPRIDDLRENAIAVAGESDGRFNSNDYVTFYADTVRGWTYDPASKQFHHYLNHYTERNVFYLTYGGANGKRITQQPSLNSQSPYRPASFADHRFLEEEEVKGEISSGLDWFGQQFTIGMPSVVYTTKLDGLVPGSSVRYDAAVLARAGTWTRFDILESDSLIGGMTLGPINFDPGGQWATESEARLSASSSAIRDNRSRLKFVYYPNGEGASGYLDWFEIVYDRRFEAVNEVLRFRSPDTNATIEYSLTGFSSSDIHVYDVTDFGSVSEISNASVSGSSFTFQAAAVSGGLREYLALGPGGYLRPASVTRRANTDLHGIADGAQMIIVTHPSLAAEANRLKAHRESFAPNSLKTIVVSVRDIYDEFGGGLPDPIAIRDFVKRAHDTWTVTPQYLLLFGDGDYDYKNITGKSHSLVPVYETPVTLDQINSYTSDDYFGLVSSDVYVDMGIGRLPAQTPDDARAVVDKIIAYETRPEFGPWRSRLTFVADDGLTTEGDDRSEHTAASDDAADNHVPGLYEKVKIYEIQYPTVIGASGRRKPDVNKAIIDQINDGTLTMNWTGHGNPVVWAHEHVFENTTTIPQLVNKNRLTFFTAATCDFGRYDDPVSQSGGELLVLKADGAGIGIVTTTRAAYSTDNQIFNNTFYSDLFTRDSSGMMPRIGDALFLTKQQRIGVNDRKFQLLGDPSLRLAAPRFIARIDSINGRAPDSVVTLLPGRKTTVRGSIHGSQSSASPVLGSFDGTGTILVHDAFKTINIPDWSYPFRVLGGTLFRGDVSVTGGAFTGEFITPRDLSAEKANGRIAFYLWNDQTDGLCATDSIAFGGVDTSPVTDTTGPRVTVYLGDRNFRSGDLVGENPSLIVDLYDQYGINLSSAGIGHQLQVWIDQSDRGIDLSNYYKGELNSYQRGTVEYPLSNLSEGEHTASVRAWDVFNNSTTAEVLFRVAPSGELHVMNVVNYPNPFTDRTTFTLQQNQSAPVDVTVKIYTVAGRLIATLQEEGLTGHFVEIPWDGRDQDGSEIANGVYLYKVITRLSGGNLTTEALGRLAKVR